MIFGHCARSFSAFGKITSAVLPNLQTKKPEEHSDENWIFLKTLVFFQKLSEKSSGVDKSAFYVSIEES